MCRTNQRCKYEGLQMFLSVLILLLLLWCEGDILVLQYIRHRFHRLFCSHILFFCSPLMYYASRSDNHR